MLACLMVCRPAISAALIMATEELWFWSSASTSKLSLLSEAGQGRV
jgi:hypothetical protein